MTNDIKQEIERASLINNSDMDIIISKASQSVESFNNYLYTLTNMREVDKIINILLIKYSVSTLNTHRILELAISEDQTKLFTALFNHQHLLFNNTINIFNEYAFKIATKDFNKDIIELLLLQPINLNIDNKKYLFRLADNVFYLPETNDIIIKILADKRLTWYSEDEKIDFLAYCAKLNLTVIVKHLIITLNFNAHEAARYSIGELKIWCKTYEEQKIIQQSLSIDNLKTEEIRKI